jgi:hypothetical protein
MGAVVGGVLSAFMIPGGGDMGADVKIYPRPHRGGDTNTPAKVAILGPTPTISPVGVDIGPRTYIVATHRHNAGGASAMARHRTGGAARNRPAQGRSAGKGRGDRGRGSQIHCRLIVSCYGGRWSLDQGPRKCMSAQRAEKHGRSLLKPIVGNLSQHLFKEVVSLYAMAYITTVHE